MTLPANWTYAKIDLFDNATSEELVVGKRNFKAALNYKTKDSDEWQRYWIALNSPKRHVWRNVKDFRNTPHFKLVKNIMRTMETDYRVSKFYDAERQTAFGLTGFLVPEEQGYMFMLVYKEQVIGFELSGAELTQQQRSKNMIASGDLKVQTAEKKPRRWID